VPKWIRNIRRHFDLGDSRRADRIEYMAECFAARPGLSIPQTFSDWTGTKGAYRALSNDKITPEAIVAGLRDDTVTRVHAEPTMVLALHDTTSLDFSDHPATAGLGPLGGGDGSAGHGFWAHSVLAASAIGVPLGLLHQQTWVRDPDTVGKHHQRRDLPIEEKESYRWQVGLRAVHSAVPEHSSVLNIGDREADIYALLAEPRRAKSHLLIRASQPRRVQGEHKNLWAAVEAASEAGRHEMLVRQHPTHTMRKVTVAVRFCEVTLLPPANGVRDTKVPSVTVTAILAREVEGSSDTGHAPLEWLLLTDLPVEDFHDAVRMLRYYGLRWLIERFHYTLKSGCKLEDRQLRTVGALLRLLAIYCIVAWRLLWLTYAAREHGDEPCTVAFSELEWHILYWRRHGRKALPAKPPSLREATRWLGQLGGFLARKGDGEPGVKVLWRGIMELHSNVTGYLLANPFPQDVGNA
jgi:hypothetical protein